MNQTENLREVTLSTALDQTISLAEELNISESELVKRLLLRYQIKSDKCRSVIHVAGPNNLLKKKLFDGKAGP